MEHGPGRPALDVGETNTSPVGGHARLLIVDDHHLIRGGLRQLFGAIDSVTVVAEASSGREAIEVWQHLRTPLVLMDVEMPGMDGIEATQVLKRRDPNVVVVCMNASNEPDRILDGLRAGANGFVLKDGPSDEIIDLVARAWRGEPAIAPALASRLLVRLAMEAGSEPAMPEALTARELEVLRLMAGGNTNREIAHRLIVAVGTVKVHVEHILHKLGAADRTEAAVRGVELGLVHARQPDASIERTRTSSNVR